MNDVRSSMDSVISASGMPAASAAIRHSVAKARALESSPSGADPSALTCSETQFSTNPIARSLIFGLLLRSGYHKLAAGAGVKLPGQRGFLQFPRCCEIGARRPQHHPGISTMIEAGF